MTQTHPEIAPNRALGLLAAAAVLVIWSGFIVVSRAGVLTDLTPGDITALRFAVAGTVCLPFVWAWWPRHLGVGAVALIVICGSGALYSMLIFWGLRDSSAAFAGVFTNGALPFFTVLIVTAMSGRRPSILTLLSLVIVTAGAVMVALSGLQGALENPARAIALFLAAAAIQSVYIFGVRRWRLTPRQALVTINIPNALIFLPLWYFLLPSGLAQAAWPDIALQAAYQGLGPGLLAMICFALAAQHLGPTHTAGFSAAVPATAALLAIPVLDEIPGPVAWSGIALVTLGLLLLVRAKDS